jgi:hypothetical protein
MQNPATKISQAVKAIQSQHRLILSGTPIQNNVLELWSLFDFLMPGFLGTEKVFREQYSKPILASKDGKASSQAQEAGALALEALHRQVLPFLLRRVKEDVLGDLPPKIIQDYYCDLSPIQRMLYEACTPQKAHVSIYFISIFQKVYFFSNYLKRAPLIFSRYKASAAVDKSARLNRNTSFSRSNTCAKFATILHSFSLQSIAFIHKSSKSSHKAKHHCTILRMQVN